MRALNIIALLSAILLVPVLRGQDVSSLIKKANELDSADRTLEAIEVLKQAEKSSPDNAQVLIKLSQDYADAIDIAKEQSKKLANAKSSLEYARKAVEIAPQNSDAHTALSVAYGKMTDFVDNKTKMEYSKVIKSEAEKAVDLNPRNDVALLILARWNFDMATLNPFLKAIAQTMYGQLPPASKEKAVEYFQKAIAADPNRIMNHADYARALETMGQNSEARGEWAKVAQLKPADAQDRSDVAEAQRKLR